MEALDKKLIVGFRTGADWEMSLKNTVHELLNIVGLELDEDENGYVESLSEALANLISAGVLLVDEIELPAKTRGRKMKLLQVTPKGREYLEKVGMTEAPKGRGGAKHLYYQRMIRDWYERKAHRAEIEATVGNTWVDVLVLKSDGTCVGIEIALSPQYEETNALNAQKSGIEHLIFVCEDENMLKQVQQRIASAMPKQIRLEPEFNLISDYSEKI